MTSMFSFPHELSRLKTLRGAADSRGHLPIRTGPRNRRLPLRSRGCTRLEVSGLIDWTETTDQFAATSRQSITASLNASVPTVR